MNIEEIIVRKTNFLSLLRKNKNDRITKGIKEVGLDKAINVNPIEYKKINLFIELF